MNDELNLFEKETNDIWDYAIHYDLDYDKFGGYKEFKKSYGAISLYCYVKDNKLKYNIVDFFNNCTLDDCGGFGYNSEQAALKFWINKKNRFDCINEKCSKHIRKFLFEYPKLRDELLKIIEDADDPRKEVCEWMNKTGYYFDCDLLIENLE